MTFGPRQYVFKAKMVRTRVKVPSSTRRLDRFSRNMEGPVSIGMLSGIRTFKKRVRQEDVRAAIASGNTDAVMRSIPWDKMGDDLEPMLVAVTRTLESSAKLAALTVPSPKDKSLRFDLKNPALKEYLQTRTGALVKDITDGQRDIIRQAVKNSFAVAKTPRAIARQLQDKIGLTDAQATAVDNHRAALEESGYSASVADVTVSRYSDRLLEQRALTIAQTETAQATGNAQLAVWHSARSQGLLPPSVMKQWIINPGACAKICAPMDGVAVPLAQAWVISTGRKGGGTRRVMTPSESHPRCRCLASLKFDDSDAIVLGDE